MNRNVRFYVYRCIEECLKKSYDEEMYEIARSGVSDAHSECRIVCRRILENITKEKNIDGNKEENKGEIKESNKEGEKSVFKEGNKQNGDRDNNNTPEPNLNKMPNRAIVQENKTTRTAFGTGFMSYIPRKAKAAIETLRKYSPFRKQAKTNENKPVKISEFKMKETKKLISLSEVPIKRNEETLTPRKLQDYINSYKNTTYVDKKYLVELDKVDGSFYNGTYEL